MKAANPRLAVFSRIDPGPVDITQQLVDDQIVNAGGRVLGVTALGDTLADAKLHAYQAVKCIRWEGAWCRKDISDKAAGR